MARVKGARLVGSADVLRVGIVLLSLAGVCLAARFTWAFYASAARRRRDTQAPPSRCLDVLEAPQAAVWGVPNALLGLVWYGLILLWVLWPAPLAAWHWTWRAALVGSAWTAVGLGVYLTHALLVVLRLPCRLCLLSHGINAALALLLSVAAAAPR